MASGLFGIGTSGLTAAQRALETTGHNISNANTAGYSRQRTELVTRAPQGAADGFIGTGVDVSTVRRTTDRFVTEQLRVSTASHAEASTLFEFASQIDNILADPQGALSPAIQEFFTAWHDVSIDPSSVPARQVLLSEGESLAQRFQSLQLRLGDTRKTAEGKLDDLVVDINTLAQGIADVNEGISGQRGAFGDQPPNDLLDRREELLRQLSEIVNVHAIEQDDGALNITVGSGQALLTGTTVTPLSVVQNPFDPTRTEVGYATGGLVGVITPFLTGGELGGIVRFRDEVLDPAENTLGLAALGLVTTLNEQHQLGSDLNGELGEDFFRPMTSNIPAVHASSANTGAPPAQLSLTLRDPSALVASDYQLDRTAGGFTLTRLSDGTVTPLTGFPTTSEVVGGLEIELASGAIAVGDSFLLEPTRSAAQRVELNLTSTDQVAAAGAVRAAAAGSNQGSGIVGELLVNLPSDALEVRFNAPPTTFDLIDAASGNVLVDDAAFTTGATIAINGMGFAISGAPTAGDVFTVSGTMAAIGPGNGGTGSVSQPTIAAPDPNLRDAVTITFNDPPSTFTVAGATTGAPVVNVPFTPGNPVSFNGWRLTIEGAPAAGDVFTVSGNQTGVGDNHNARAIADLQTAETLLGHSASYEEVYGQLVASVGTRTRQAEIEEGARAALRDQITATREGISGVNLDEEAANLLRFQQAFEANAQVIAAASEIFQTLMAAVSR